MAEQPAERAPYVFLSYTSPERDRAFALADRLEQAGIRVWLDRRSLVGGASWDAAIVRAIKDCTVFAVLCSPASVVSPNVAQELRLAWEEQRSTLPLLLERVAYPDELRYILAGRQWVELLDRPEEDWLPDVLAALAGLGLRPSRRRAGGRRRDPSATLPTPTTHAAPRRPAAASVRARRDAPPAPAPATNLPAPLTSFIGREQELAAVTVLLGSTCLLTLTGPGGTGKTRLALAAAAQVAQRFPDGVWFVDLSGVSDPAGVIPAIAQVLRVTETEGRSLAVSLTAYLRSKRLLLVLDNFEQVVGAALQVYDLLVEATALSVLVTSRVLLRVGGEQQYAVPPLPLLEADEATDMVVAAQNPAVQLFVERARALRPDFALTAENAPIIAGICTRLDGLPLAIELAAARLRLLPPPALLARLEQRLKLLTGGERSRPERQQTLRAAIQWSWELLEEPERMLFRRLGVFAGGWTLEAVETVCNPDGDLDILDGLASLVDKSLARQNESNGEPRFSMLATLQEFALEQLEQSGEAAGSRRGHAEFYCELADRADTAYWRRGQMLVDLLRPLDPEHNNFSAALQRAALQQDSLLGLRLVGSLGTWFSVRAPSEGLRWAEQFRDAASCQEDRGARGSALYAAGACALVQNRPEQALAFLDEAADCLRTAEDLPALSRVLALIGYWAPPDRWTRARRGLEEALALAASEPYTLAYAELSTGGAMVTHGGDLEVSRAHLERALRLAHSLAADWLEIFAARLLALVALEQGRYPEAEHLLHAAHVQAERLGDRWALAIIGMDRARLARTEGDSRGEATEWRRALVLAHELGNRRMMAIQLVGIARLLAAYGLPADATRLLSAGVSAASLDSVDGPSVQHVSQDAAPALAATRAALSAEAFAQAWAEGQALSLDEAVAEALRATAPEASG